MSAFTLIGILLVVLVGCWAVWFVVELIRYIVNDDDEIDQRLRSVSR